MCEFRLATEDDFEGICRLVKSEEELFLVYPGGKYPFTHMPFLDGAYIDRPIRTFVQPPDSL